MSGSLPATGSTVMLKAWDYSGNEISTGTKAPQLLVYNYGTTIIPGTDIRARFPGGTPAAYTIGVNSSKMLITNVNGLPDGSIKAPIFWSNGLNNFVSNTIGSLNAIKVTDVSGTIASGGIPITVTAWDASGKAIPESLSAEPMMLYSHGTTSITGSSLMARFRSPMTYQFSIASPKLVITNLKYNADMSFAFPSIYTAGLDNYVSNSTGSQSFLVISEFSGGLSSSGAAISIRAWDASGVEIPEKSSAISYKIYNYGTITIAGSALIDRFSSSGPPMTYELTVQSPSFMITNRKFNWNGKQMILTAYTKGITGYTTNYVGRLYTTINISDMSGSLPTSGAPITITARDAGGKIIPNESSTLLKLYNHGTITITGKDLLNSFPSGVPASFQFSVDSSNAVFTQLTQNFTPDGSSVNVPMVYITGNGGI